MRPWKRDDTITTPTSEEKNWGMRPWKRDENNGGTTGNVGGVEGNWPYNGKGWVKRDGAEDADDDGEGVENAWAGGGRAWKKKRDVDEGTPAAVEENYAGTRGFVKTRKRQA